MKLKEINKNIEEERKNGKTIVTCNGCFDLIHIGHIEFLEEAKSQGDILIVGINSDDYIKNKKGDNRPIFNEEQRMKVLMALKPVDYVFVFDEETPNKFLGELKPDVHVNGAEYGENCVETQVLNTYGGKLHLIKKKTDISTTQILEKLKE